MVVVIPLSIFALTPAHSRSILLTPAHFRSLPLTLTRADAQISTEEWKSLLYFSSTEMIWFYGQVSYILDKNTHPLREYSGRSIIL